MMSDNFIIGMSYWGGLSGNLKDSPDGAVYTRNLIIKKFLEEGHKVIALQINRDDETFVSPVQFDSGFPDIDLLFVEWRWALPGRNTAVDRNSPSFTPDLDRQTELLRHYLQNTNAHVFIWDKDQTLTKHDFIYNNNILSFHGINYLKFKHRIDFCRNTLKNQCLEIDNFNLFFKRFTFPCDFKSLKNSAIENFEKEKTKTFVYIGNQYRRDEQVYQFVVPTACHFKFTNVHHDFDFYGNWTKYSEKFERNKVNFPAINFYDRITFNEIHNVYHNYLCTLNMAPKEYMDTGQFTQRIYEAVMNGVITIGISDHECVERVFPKKLIVRDAYDFIELIKELTDMYKNSRSELLDLFEEQIDKLEYFDISKWYTKFASDILFSIALNTYNRKTDERL